MLTQFGKELNKSAVLTEYPRPQLMRNEYMTLNGYWDYAITANDDYPAEFDGKILVPFSPESELSGVMRTLDANSTLWYSVEFTLPAEWNNQHVLLHFGAVDQCASIYLNSREIGSHVGGFNAFYFDITEALEDVNHLVVRVHDHSDTSYHSRGKQKNKRGGIWYTPQSGIWQTVWLEPVPANHIEELRIVPLFDESAVEITVESSYINTPIILRTGDVVAHGQSGVPVRMSMEGFLPWTPEEPNLYDLEISAGEDKVKSYFAMRKFSVDRDEAGTPRLFLNNKPYFHNGVLDQGYYPDGLYTPPSDEAMINDILTMKRMGFNTLRKHIKVEPMRWYYHCDTLGMLVWQDMPNGGGNYNPLVISTPLITGKHIADGPRNYRRFGRDEEAGREQYMIELNEMIHQLINCPCIAMWVPFNEGWGQFDSAEACNLILSIDSTRTIDHASGWHDQGIGQLQSLHVYFKPYRFKTDKYDRAVILTEFGGYNRRIDGHCFNRKDFGYKRFKSDEDLFDAFKRLYKEEIIPAKAQGLSAAIYTQLSDVEDELNGILTYDRAIAKLPENEVAEIMKELV